MDRFFHACELAGLDVVRVCDGVMALLDDGGDPGKDEILMELRAIHIPGSSLDTRYISGHNPHFEVWFREESPRTRLFGKRGPQQ